MRKRHYSLAFCLSTYLVSPCLFYLNLLSLNSVTFMECAQLRSRFAMLSLCSTKYVEVPVNFHVRVKLK
jgi:hypothetical protein